MRKYKEIIPGERGAFLLYRSVAECLNCKKRECDYCRVPNKERKVKHGTGKTLQGNKS